MGAIADRIATMRGCSLREIVDEIARLEAERDFGALGVGVANDFEKFWSLYPAKIAKKTALAAFKKAVKTVDFDVIMSGLEAYVNKTDDRPWCHASTWLNQERWNDQPVPTTTKLKGLAGERARLQQEIADGDRSAGETSDHYQDAGRLAYGGGQHDIGNRRQLR